MYDMSSIIPCPVSGDDPILFAAQSEVIALDGQQDLDAWDSILQSMGFCVPSPE